MVALGAALVVMHHHALADLRFLGVDRAADRDHHAAGFVPGDDGAVAHRDAAGLALALGAAVLMQIAAAHAGRLHLDDDIVSVRRGIGELHQFQFAFAVEYHAAHGFLRCYCSQADTGRKTRIGKVRTSRELPALMTGSSISILGFYLSSAWRLRAADTTGIAA